MKEKQRENRCTFLIICHFITSSQFSIVSSEFSEAEPFTLLWHRTTPCPSSSCPFSLAFSASALLEVETQDPRSGHYPCENIRSWFLPLTGLVWFVPLTRQGSPQSQPQALSPGHWLPWIQGLCLFSSAHPFQTHISQTRIPKAVFLFSYQLDSLPSKPLLTTLMDVFLLPFIIVSTEAINKPGLTVQFRALLGGLQFDVKLSVLTLILCVWLFKL